MMADAGALPAALRFTAADLEANRQGLLSSAQIERMKRIRQRDMLVAAAIFLALVFAATVLFYLGQLNRNMILYGAGVLLIVFNAVVVGKAGQATMRVGGDLSRGHVDALAGNVERVLRRGRAGDTYLLRINGAELSVTKDVFIAFQHMAPHRIYRASVSGVLLSAERLS